ncbi:hypothetical protein [Roseateles depolymerans]|uniref:Uncharacterized protein n=1 Tax=Roseateles depolymerans TaxID=76731 RepID=A0A0U3LPZ7_9BURK|nr:hypothetical protein [Roseateles depolymerans]ALV07047.1 hypothetical protein RD2015_2582 [Roseateles depolymerans]REG20030.1 hypothetical protein DES44_2536 [Roseateles depolymerans]
MANIDTSITNYFVVPLKRQGSVDPTVIEACYYYDINWNKTDAKDLRDTEHQNSVCLRQCDVRTIDRQVLDSINTDGFVVNRDVRLFSATAKTLGGNAGMPNLLLAREEPYALVNGEPAPAWSVTIPLAPNTRRGVILVFSYDAGGRNQLVATTDPEVGNGSSN